MQDEPDIASRLGACRHEEQIVGLREGNNGTKDEIVPILLGGDIQTNEDVLRHGQGGK
jgi:hypothetical protein